MRINFLGLQAFLSIAERGSFRSAAQHLNLSQTAISHRMRKLEDELGLKLFARTTREVTLTKAGVELMEKAKRIVGELEGALDETRQLGRRKRSRLSIACLPAFSNFRLPPVLSKFRNLHPDVEVRIFEGSSVDIAQLLQSEEVEFGLSVVSTNRWDFEVEPLIRTDPMVLACQARHSLARKASVRWTDLRGLPLIRVGPDTTIRMLIDDALGSLKDELDWQCEVQRVETAVTLVDAGCGLAVVPQSNVQLYGSRTVVGKPLRNPLVTCAIGLVTKRGVPLSGTAEDFMTLLRERLDTEQRAARRNH